MRRTLFLICLSVFAGAALAAPAPAQPAAGADASPSAGASAPEPYRPPDFTAVKWTGDLGGMVQRRMIRVLVPYSKIFYFVDRAVQHGLAYEAGQRFETELNRKLKTGKMKVHLVFLPVARDEMIPALLEGRGDIAVGNLTVTPERLGKVDFSAPSRSGVDEIVVTAPGQPPVATAEDLSGREVYVRPSSSFVEGLNALNARLAAAGKPLVRIRPAPEVLEQDDILEMVAAGLVSATVADNYVAEFWSRIFPGLGLCRTATLRTGGQLGWMFRKNSPALKAEVDAFLGRYPEGSAQRARLMQKYLQSTKWVKPARSEAEFANFQRTVELFRKYSGQYALDFLLMIAEGYQESGLNQKARSPVGAIGIMQLMPPTGRSMKVGDIRQLEPNIHAGIKFVRFMMDQYFEGESLDRLDKGLFACAAYNAGPGRVDGLRKLAAKRGLDPNRWFNNVELVAAERIGRETVQYVSNIYKYYLAYQMSLELVQERSQVKPEGARP